ncbi:hypothetical protein BH10ACT7_BH10ACT7_08530 [soil metagenome]
MGPMCSRLPGLAVFGGPVAQCDRPRAGAAAAASDRNHGVGRLLDYARMINVEETTLIL